MAPEGGTKVIDPSSDEMPSLPVATKNISSHYNNVMPHKFDFKGL